MKIGTFVASLVFLRCFDVNESQKYYTLLQGRIEVQLGTRGDNVCEAISATTVERHVHMVYALLKG